MRFIFSTSILFLCILLTGCLNHTEERNEFKQNLLSMKGEPASVAFSKLGYPDNEGMVAGRKFYVWSTSYMEAFPSTPITTGIGSIGGTSFNYSQATYGETENIQLRCMIRIFVDKKDIIQDADFKGNYGGCHPYAKKLKILPSK